MQWPEMNKKIRINAKTKMSSQPLRDFGTKGWGTVFAPLQAALNKWLPPLEIIVKSWGFFALFMRQFYWPKIFPGLLSAACRGASTVSCGDSLWIVRLPFPILNLASFSYPLITGHIDWRIPKSKLIFLAVLSLLRKNCSTCHQGKY